MAKIAARTAGTTGTKCCCDPAILTDCRKRTGSATLCGWPEYIVSTPPRLYRNKVYTGTKGRSIWTNTLTCAGNRRHLQEYVLSGTARRANGESDGFCTILQYATITTLWNGEIIQVANWDSDAGIGFTEVERTITTTATTRQYDAIDTCFPDSSQGSSSRPFGYGLESLGDEDTDAAAEARATGAWGAWYAKGASGCTDCCVASRQVRTTGITFNFQASQFRLGIEEGPVDEIYTVALDYMRREIGDTEWIKVATDYFSVVSTEPEASRDGWPAYPVPQLAGYETTIDNIRIYNPDE